MKYDLTSSVTVYYIFVGSKHHLRWDNEFFREDL